MSTGSICLFPRLEHTGGPSSFQMKLTTCLQEQGIEVHFDPSRKDVTAILVVGGSSHLAQLAGAKKRGIRIVQRLDGMNWLHKKTRTGVSHFLRAEWNNFILSVIRRRYADSIVYQSDFTRNWWNQVYGLAPVGDTVIHNGVDLSMFSPTGTGITPADLIRIMVVEGSFYGGHERDLLNAVGFAHGMAELAGKRVELVIASRAPQSMLAALPSYPNLSIRWLGIVPLADIPELDRSAHIFFPAEINAACPNTVIEAMACGLPIVSFATGSLPELVEGDAGRIVPYGADYWNLEAPDFNALCQAGLEVFNNQTKFRSAARKRAETYFDMHNMAQKYLAVLIP
ncbi:MAG: glycosyltransferase [Anaerolineaceae bacterium]|jgi:glycosyltransferase involved in cell wall biosynthesis|nr:MAG: glycosyltransferase [Anaerolineaceae bacterium]